MIKLLLRRLILRPSLILVRFIISLTPRRFRSFFLDLISDSLTSKDGLLLDKAVFDLNFLQGFSESLPYRQTYNSSIMKANDQHTDNIYKILRYHNLYSYIDSVLSNNIPGDFAEGGTRNGNSLFDTIS